MLVKTTIYPSDLSVMSDNKIKTLTFDSNSTKDRKDVFVRVCELLNLNQDNQVKNFKIGSTAAGLNVNIEKLFSFLNKHKLSGEFDFETKKIVVYCPEIPLVGKAMIENPETLKPTSVDGEDGFVTVEANDIEEEVSPPEEPKVEEKATPPVEPEDDDGDPF